MDKYANLGVAGEGTYGVVLKCKHKDTGKVVAIKKFKEPDEDEQAKKCTEREVKLLTALKHENIIEMSEAFRRKGILYLVFEFVEKSMMDLLDTHPNGLSNTSVRRLSHQLTRALEHCHKNNVIHRDVKPENLLITADESLRLCDFGSARKLTGTSTPLTDYVATRWYRAPELLLSTDNYSKSVDMWGLACVAAELCDGRPLFAGESDLDQLSVIQKALGPLTRGQVARYMELSDFRGTKFPTAAAQPDFLEKRLGKKAPGEQQQFLQGILKMEPSQRLTAAAALAMPWFQGMEAAAQPAVQQPRQHVVPLRRKSRTPSPAESVASEIESEPEEMEEVPSRPGSSRRESCTPRQLSSLASASASGPNSARAPLSARKASAGSLLRPPSRSSRPASRGMQVLPAEHASPRAPASQQASPAAKLSRPASRSKLLPRPESSSRRSLALPRAGGGSRPPSAEKPAQQSAELRSLGAQAASPRPSPRRTSPAPALASPSMGSAPSASRRASPRSAADQSLSSPGKSAASQSSRPRKQSRPGSASASASVPDFVGQPRRSASAADGQEASVSDASASDTVSPAAVSSGTMASYQGRSRSLRSPREASASPSRSGRGSRRPTPDGRAASRPASGRRPSRPPSSGRPASRSAGGSGGRSSGGSAVLAEAPAPDSSYSDASSPAATASFHSDESESTATPAASGGAPVVGIVPGAGGAPKCQQAPCKKVEDSEVSYSSVPDDLKGQSKRLRSSCGESIQEEIDNSPLAARVPEELDGSHAAGRPPLGGGAARAQPFPQPWGARQGEELAAAGHAAGPAAAAFDRRPSICAAACPAAQRADCVGQKGAAGAAMVPGAKLGLIQRKGTRWKVS